MYLSRLQLDPGNRQVWRQHLRNPYKVHQLVMRGFPDGVKREAATVLHRLDIRDEVIVLLVQSAIEPDWAAIEPDYLLPPDPFDPLPNPAVKPLNLSLKADQVVSFRLRANPTIKKIRRNEDGEFLNSNRVPLVREERQIEWLQQRAENGGFRLLRATIGQAQQQKIWKRKGARPITLYTVRFEGHLQITDPDTFLEAVQNGIGPAKAFGCGLLSLAPVR